jgi:hypothetical protein
MTREEEVRKKVKALKSFYKDIINYLVVNGALIVIWFTFDRTGSFWPKYILLVWGIAIVLRASRTGVLKHFFHKSSFLSPEWEEKKVREYMRIHMLKDLKGHHRKEKEEEKDK